MSSSLPCLEMMTQLSNGRAEAGFETQVVEAVDFQKLSLAIALMLVVVYTLAPFEFDFSTAEWLARWRDSLTLPQWIDGPKLLGHFAAFFVLGALVVTAYPPAFERVGWFIVSSLLFCGLLEVVQTFEQTRHPRGLDFLCNCGGLLLGGWGALRWRWLSSLRAALRDCVRGHAMRLQGGLLILAGLAWSSIGLRPAFGALDLRWDEHYKLSFGNESSLDRPWSGEMKYVRIYDRALKPSEIENRDGNAEGTQAADGLLLSYDFTKSEKKIMPIGRLGAEALRLEVPEEASHEAGALRLGQGTLLSTVAPAATLTRALVASKAFTVEAWVRPLNDQQGGPARIVSLSEGIWRGNFMLGQEGSDFVFRVRNGVSGLNGANEALQVKAPGGWHHLVASHDHGVSRVFSNGKSLGPVLDLREPPVYLNLGHGVGGRVACGLFMALLIALPVLGLVSAYGAKQRVLRHGVAVAVAIGLGSLPYGIACLCGGPWRMEYFLWFVATLLAAYPICFLWVRGSSVCVNTHAMAWDNVGRVQ